MTDRTGRRIVYVLACALLLGSACSTLYRSVYSRVHRSDFTVYTAAARAVVDGTDIYEAHNTRGWYYMYLPVFAIALVPFVWMGNFAATLIWFILSAGALIHGAVLSAKMARLAFPRCRWSVFWIASLALLLTLPVSLSGIVRGQVSLLLAYLVILGIWLHLKGRDWSAGLALAGATILKIFPAIFIPFLLITRRFRMAAVICVWLLVLIFAVPSAVFGPARNLELLTQWVKEVALPANRAVESAGARTRYEQMVNPRTRRNQSVQAVCIRTASGRVMETPGGNELIGRDVAIGINAALFLISGWVCYRTRSSNAAANRLIQYAIVTLLMLFLAPVSWMHNYVVMAFPLAMAIGGAVALEPARQRRSMGVCLGVYALACLLNLADWFQFFGALLWGGLILWAAFVHLLLRVPEKSGEHGWFTLPAENTAQIP